MVIKIRSFKIYDGVVRANDFRLLTVSRLGNDHDDSALI
jgi:hypothetical protein